MYGVRNYYGDLSFKVGKSTEGTYSGINEADYVVDGPWKNNDLDPERSYKSTYNEDTGVGTQNCGASRVIKNDSTYEMEIKSSQMYLVSTGYKIYSSARDKTVDKEKDGMPFEFIFKYSEKAESAGIVLNVILCTTAATLSLTLF